MLVNYGCGFLPLVHVVMVPEAFQKKLEPMGKAIFFHVAFKGGLVYASSVSISIATINLYRSPACPSLPTYITY